MKRKIINLSIALSLILSISTNVIAQDFIGIDFDGVNKIFQQESTVDNYIFVDANSLGNALGLSTQLENAGKSVTYTDESSGSSLTIIAENSISSFESKDGDEYNTITKEIPVVAYMSEDVLMVPLEFVCDQFDASINYNEDGTFSVNSKRTYVTSFETMAPIDENTVIYTYEEAIELSLRNNDSIKETRDNLDELEEQRDELEKSRKGVQSVESTVTNPLTGETTTIVTNVVLSVEQKQSIMLSLNKINSSIETLEDTKESLPIASEASLMNALTNINELLMSRALLEKNITLLEKALSHTQVKYELGLVSKNTLDAAQKSLNDANTSLKQLDISYAAAQRSLNNVLGKDLFQDTYVVYQPNVESIKMTDDEFERHLMVSTLKNTKVKTAKEEYDHWLYAEDINMLGGDEEEEYEESAADAQIAYNKARDSYRLSVSNTYTNLLQMEQKNETLLAALTQAKKDYNDVVASYDAGMVTPFDVEQAEMLLYNAEQALMQNALSYNLLLFQFDNPNLM
ncbi:MAG: TolC family protein [Lachnospirales bacterium]